MYNLSKQAEEGRMIMRENKTRDLRLVDLMFVNDQCNGDKFLLAERMFLIGIAIGKRIGELEK